MSGGGGASFCEGFMALTVCLSAWTGGMGAEGVGNVDLL